MHGLASNCRIWDLVGPLLAETNSVKAIDQRGHGLSSKPNQGYDFDTVTNDLHLFLETNHIENPLLVGHSWGGSVALNFAANHPEMIGGLCLVDGGLIEISSIPGNSLEKALVDMAPPLFDNLTEEFLRRRIAKRDWGERDSLSLQYDLANIVMANFQEAPKGTITPRFKRSNHLKVVEAFWNHQPSSLFSSVKCPVLNMPARLNDDETSRQTLRKNLIVQAEKNIAEFETVWLEHSIHDVPLQRPMLVAATISSHLKKGFFN
ncbi:MAG: alpha/beta hydrolase [SAR202 cluster bacterium]|nr:alpha/beta hydrolase [SAR202 cluster bacterium]